MRTFLCFIGLFMTSILHSQSLTQNLLPNAVSLFTTFNIFTDTLAGTCFAVANNNNEYIATTKHLFKHATKSGDSVTVSINVNKVETTFQARIYFHPNPLIDLAVLKLAKKISHTVTLAIKGGDSYFLGQECLFMGYPLFNIGTLTQTDKVPFVKKAIISALLNEDGIKLILLDGHNNPGFSGGPVITYSDKMSNQFVFGVISSYVNQPQKIQIKDSITESVQYSLTINENSGIVVAYPATYITEIINNIK